VTAGAERYLRRLAEADLRRGTGTSRLEAAADVLIHLGVVDRAAAQEVLNGLATAWAIRSTEEQVRRTLGGTPYPRWRERHRSTTGRPTGPVRVAPIGTTLPGGRDGETLHLLAATVAPGRGVTVTVAGRIQPELRPGRADVPIGPHGPYTRDGLGLTFAADGQPFEQRWIDDSGTCDGVWWCLEVLLPEPEDELRELEIAAVDGGEVVRVDVAAEASGAAGAGWAAEAGGVEVVAGEADGGSGAERAERAVDALGASLLWLALWPVPDDRRRAEIAAMADAVAEAGGLGADSPTRRRYAALTASLDAGSPAAGPAAEASHLPPVWVDVLAGRGRCDGPERACATAAVLPELDGAIFAVTGLVSTAESATLRVLAWGWSPDDAPELAAPFSWWARDNAGRWHVGRHHWHSANWQTVVMDVTLLPALHPAATALEVIVTGRGGTERATVPLTAS
jgi:hypothetical protein